MAEETTKEVYIDQEYLDAMLSAIVGEAYYQIVIPELPETEEEAQAAVADMLVLGEVILAGPDDDGDDRVIIIQPVPRVLAVGEGNAKAVALLDTNYKLLYAVLLQEETQIELGQPVSINNWCIRMTKPELTCEMPEVAE